MNKAYLNIGVVVLLSVFAVLAVTVAWPGTKSPTCDELAHHIPVGLVLLTKHDFKMDTSQPPLPRYIVALPLKLFMNLKMPDDKKEWRRQDRSEFGKDFFYKYNNQPLKVIFLSRLAVIIVGIFCGIILFVWARRLYGDKVALLSLFLYSFCPNIIAHSALATTDMVATCFILLSVATFWLFVEKVTLKNAFFAGVCLGLAQLSKYTAILLYPLFLLILLFELYSKDKAAKEDFVKKTLLIFLFSVLTTWAGYGFDFQPILENAMRPDQKVWLINSLMKKMFPAQAQILSRYWEYFLFHIPIPLGTHLLGILGVIRHGWEGHRTFFLGKSSGHGNPLYFVVAFLIKTPIPTLLLLLAGLWVMLKKKIRRNERFILLTILWFFVAASFSKLQLGLRYILPIYPFCFILAGRSIELGRKPWFRLLSVLLIIWYLAGSIKIWPDYLSYFNELIGGPKNGYKYLKDSNIDWGQDLPALARFMKERKINQVKLLYFGTADPASYDIKYFALDGQDYLSPKNEFYALSVNSMDSVAWIDHYKPSARLGYSIYVYDFRSPKELEQ